MGGKRESVRNISLAAAREISRPWLAISSAEEISLRLSIPPRSVCRHTAHLHKQKPRFRGACFVCGDGGNRTPVQKIFRKVSTKYILFYFPERNLKKRDIKQATLPHLDSLLDLSHNNFHNEIYCGTGLFQNNVESFIVSISNFITLAFFIGSLERRMQFRLKRKLERSRSP